MISFQKGLYLLLLLVVTNAWASSDPDKATENCSYYQEGTKNLYWGDLHIHTAYSLDAYGYGTLATPRQAYGFASGGSINLPDGSPVRLERPLDFAAVTDHAEWFDLMYICTDPEQLDNPYCETLREKNSPRFGRAVFDTYVIPTITKPIPEPSLICTEDPEHCEEATQSQWKRIQQQANDSNSPCKFSAMLAYEWSGTPNYSHTHRNIIFANENVTRDAIDYIRYPKTEELWEQLDLQCKPEQGCDVIAIPHNTNMGDGASFDVETESDRSRQFRRRYERLIEIHQEKGNSECLPPFGSETMEDCDFEIRLTKNSRPTKRADYTEGEWAKMRSSYVRGLLLRGLQGYDQSAAREENPLQLGIIGSTDNHSSTPGYVNEEQWQGSVYGLGDFDRNMTRVDWNPGGLVGVWAEQNTRMSVFAALKRREVYGTSGPRIAVKFSASLNGKAQSCEQASDRDADIVMGGEFHKTSQAPIFNVMAQRDKRALQEVEIIKGEWRDGQLKETRIAIWKRDSNGDSLCQAWRDDTFDPSVPAFWYPRILEVPTPRWSAIQCELAGRCDDYPQAVSTIQERAWASPIWYLPPHKAKD